MAGRGHKDALLEVLRVCRHGIGFRYGAQLDLPVYNRLRPPHPKDKPWPTLYRLIQAASPPPSRLGKPWQDGLRLDGKPFDPYDDSWKDKDVRAQQGIPCLDQPAPRTIVLDKWLSLPHNSRSEPNTMSVTGKDPWGFLSVRYLQPPGDDVVVNYLGAYTCHWDRLLDPGAWAAISFERFWPQERDSADYLTQVGECSQRNCTLYPPSNDPDQAA